MAKPIKLSVVRDERSRKEAKERRAAMYGNIRAAVKECGDGASGYAFVIWNKQGANWSCMRAGSPILGRIAPTFVGDALTQHATIDIMSDK